MSDKMERTTLRLPEEMMSFLDVLIDKEEFSNRSEALRSGVLLLAHNYGLEKKELDELGVETSCVENLIEEMSIDMYQVQTRDTVVYPEDADIEYLTIGLNNEAGEVAGIVKKNLRGDYGHKTMEKKVKDESGDVFWYLVRLLDELDIKASDVLEENIKKTQVRKEKDEWS